MASTRNEKKTHDLSNKIRDNAAFSICVMFTRTKFEPEPWMGELSASLPSSRVSLALLPTPIHALKIPADLDVYISLKRDDMTSFELSGNKVRKLEFLLADALEKGYDSVVTIGKRRATNCLHSATVYRQLH